MSKGDIKPDDGRLTRIGGEKVCEECGLSFQAFRDWDKYCGKKCGRVARGRRYWAKKIAAEKK